jgi:diguanylate cyclase (GGDEF)-like protein
MPDLDSPLGAVDHDLALAQDGYEPWVFRTMLGELAVGELGIGFIYNLIDRLAERYELEDVVVVLADESFGTQTFRLGAHVETVDMIAKIGTEPGVFCVPPVVPDVECEAVRAACQLALSLQLARFRAGQDALTNIANRRSFDSALQVATSRSARYGWPFTLVLVDLDDFKSINDESGHEFGDYLLRQFGFALRRAVRGGDTPARIGGDEFAVILNNAEGNEALGFTDRLRVQLKTTGNPIDFSVGTASSPRESTDPLELFRLADVRLYEKKGGSRG